MNTGPADSTGGRAAEQERRAAEGVEGGAGGGTVHITSMSGGAIATGPYGHAAHYAAPQGATDEATRALLEAVDTLREHIRLLQPTEETAEVDGELEEVQGDIARTGRADSSRLERLRARLEAGATAVGGLASAAAVTQAVGELMQ
ncbi:hypothetical protein LHJ74_21705 [Streptomyces sp. N2-109]|uniref:Uncharacterized protein n=1 Tax=Streptomyces gossypii TaxID=2883101 RepID=A0ABT2JX86_9ACTN|nr:hypothetical protein [Streptomyces gossypii]MCT2592491.1 hypothetical protein [Streptomyces gossypii]